MFLYTAAKKELLRGKKVALSGWNNGTALFVRPEFRTPDLLEANIERRSFSGDMDFTPTEKEKSARDWIVVPSAKCDECRFILPTCQRKGNGVKGQDGKIKWDNIIDCEYFVEY